MAEFAQLYSQSIIKKWKGKQQKMEIKVKVRFPKMIILRKTEKEKK